MAIIPQHESKELPSASPGGAMVPEGMAHSGPEAALERAGDTIANIGAQWSDKIAKAKQARELSTGTAELSTRLHTRYSQLLQSPEFQTDPEKVQAQWNQEAPKIMGDVANRITDRDAKAHFQNISAGHLADYTNSMTDATRKQTVEWLRASGQSNLETFQNLAIAAPSDDIFQKHMTDGMATWNGLLAKGAITPEQYEKGIKDFQQNSLKGRATQAIQNGSPTILQELDDPNGKYSKMDEGNKIAVKNQAVKHNIALQREQRQEEKYADEKRVKEANTYATNYLIGSHRLNSATADFGEAYSEAMDPEKATELGLTTADQRAHVGNTIMAMGAKFAKDKDDKQKKVDQGLLHKAYRDEIDPGGITNYTDPDTKQPASESAVKAALKWANSEESAKNKTDMKVFTDLRDQILSRKIKDPQELTPYGTHGLGRSGMDDLTRLIETVNDPKKNQWFDMAIKAYDARAKKSGSDPEEAANKRTQFITGLAQNMEDKQLKGTDILEVGTKMANSMFSGEEDTSKDTLFPKGKTGQPAPQSAQPGGKTGGKPQESPVALQKGTGAPVYKQPDGSYAADPDQKPQIVGRVKATGEPVYLMPDGSHRTIPKEGATAPKPEPPPIPESAPDAIPEEEPGSADELPDDTEAEGDAE